MSTILQKAFDKQVLLSCTGYDPGFIGNGSKINIENIVTDSLRDALPDVEGNTKKILHYTNLSVLYNGNRRVPFAAAYNIDGNAKAKGIKRAGGFKADPRLATEIQLDQAFYDLDTAKTEFEIGHMAANNEMAWGKTAQLQSYMTFHFPNSVPQAENLNTGIWKTLESYIIDESSLITNNQKVCVFSGPVLGSKDPEYVKDHSFQIPLLFYKVIVFSTSAGTFSTGFLMSHEERMKKDKMFVKTFTVETEIDPDANILKEFKYKKVFQVNLDLIESVTGLGFAWKKVNRIPVPAKANQIKIIRGIKDSADARAKEAMLRNGEIPANSIALDVLTAPVAAKKDFKLNIILPAS